MHSSASTRTCRVSWGGEEWGDSREVKGKDDGLAVALGYVLVACDRKLTEEQADKAQAEILGHVSKKERNKNRSC